MDPSSIELFRKDGFPSSEKNLKHGKQQVVSWAKFGIVVVTVVALFSVGLFFIRGSNQKVRLPVPHFLKLKERIVKVEVHGRQAKTNVSVSDSPQCSSISDELKFDCLPSDSPDQTDCMNRGCCWQQPEVRFPPLNTPYCFFPSNFMSYSVSSITSFSTRTIVILSIQRASGYIKDVNEVMLDIISLDDNKVRLRFYDPNNNRFEVPIPRLNAQVKPLDSPLYRVSVTLDGILDIIRVSTNKSIFSTNLNQLIFSDQFIELKTLIPTTSVYGLGEHLDTFKKDVTWKRYTMWNRDQSPTYNSSLYGTHPFYLGVEDDEGNSHGVLLFNSNAMDILMQPAPAITWRTIGGILDYYIFLGPSPSNVIQQFIGLIGKPQLPPYWGLGFQLCRYGYGSLKKTVETWNRTRQAGIPFDVQWNDIDFMDKFKDFTIDNATFQGLPGFVDQLHETGMHYIMMTDPGMSSQETPGTYPAFDVGNAMNIFVKNASGQNLIGKVWTGGDTVWPDFSDPNSVLYWTQQFKNFHDVVKFDGTWIDMNEPSNFVDGSKWGCPNNNIENPQYVPGGTALNHKTLCLTAQQYAGLHYNLHNLYGIYEARATSLALNSVLGKRSVIISRATATGFGNFASHWDGDIWSTWEQMRWTIPSILEFNMFGVPFIGADICGFNGNTTEELCARWSTLGAFYPFSRNHNSNDAIEQDPVIMGPVVTSAAKYALELRYSLMSYLYTQMYRAHLFGDMAVRPLFFEFIQDTTARAIESQFLWGSGLMIIPVLEQGLTSVNAYFPNASWYDIVSHQLLSDAAQYKTLEIPLDRIVVALRGGTIISRQDAQVTTTKTRKQNFKLLAALDGDGKACGEIYWDDGEDLYSDISSLNHVEYSIKERTLHSKPVISQYERMPLEEVVILGVKNAPAQVQLNGAEVPFVYDENLKRLQMSGLVADLMSEFSLTWE